MDKIKIVAIGGGSGLSTLLRGLKNYPISLSAVVTMTDNGASSGRLSRELGSLPPGDVRKCLAALSRDEELLTQLFEYRFSSGRGINGHSLGNLLLIALSEITGDFEKAVEASSKILSIKGEVIPSTLEHVSLLAKLKNGQVALGEEDIPIGGHRFGIDKILLVPESIKANPKALYFISNADVLVFGPGSMYTSILPNLLIKDIKQAICASSAKKIYICNTSTERGETEGFSVEDHLLLLKSYLGKAEIDAMVVNNFIVRSDRTNKLGAVENITTDKSKIGSTKIVVTPLIDKDNPLYHNHRLLADAIWSILTDSHQSQRRSLHRNRSADLTG